jgi:uncharacterized coiled-coil DUF342 family protein
MSEQSRDERRSRFSDVDFVAGIQSQMERRLERVRQTNQQLQAKVQELRATNGQLKTALDQNREATMNFGEQVAAVTVALVNAHRQNDELRATVDTLTTNEVELRSKIHELTAEIERLRLENRTLQTNNQLLENERSALLTGFL